MRVSRRRGVAGAAVAVLLALTALGVSAVRADPTPSLPAVGAEELLTSTLRALSEPFTISGDVSTILDLGLPELPVEGQVGAGPVTGPLATLLGRQSFKVWSSPDGVRIAHLLDFGEQDLVANGDAAWYWDSGTMTAWRLRASDLPSTGRHESGVPTDEDVLAATRAILRAVAPYADVAMGETTRVAGRPSYQLVLTPRSDLTRIGSIVAMVDAETRLPLGLRVVPRDTDRVAIQSLFTAVSFDPIDPSMFAFDPPPGSTVRDVVDGVHRSEDAFDDPAPIDPNGLRVFGTGFDLRFAVPVTGDVPAELARLLPYEGPLASAILVRRSGQRWLLVGFVDTTTLERDAATL